MAIALPPHTLKRMQASIKRYAAENLDAEIGDLKATLLLDFILKEIAPAIYNHAVADAQTYLQGRLVDLEAICYEEEFSFWSPPGSGRTSR